LLAGVVADTAVGAADMVEAASVEVMVEASAAEAFVELAWAVGASMGASPVAAFAEAVDVSRGEASEVAVATEATVMVEATDMAMTDTDWPEVFLPAH